MRKAIPKSVRKTVYEKYGGHCAYCGCLIKYEEMQVDHVKPVYVSEIHNQEPDNEISNLMPACRQCNFYKSTYDLDKFCKNIRTIPQRLSEKFIFKLGVKYGIIQTWNIPIGFYFEKCEESPDELEV